MGKEVTIILKQGEYLSDVLPNRELPHGLIVKEETGIGATSVELFNDSRSTILVFPNKALAATKTISTKKKHPQKKIFYDGSEFYLPGEQLPKLTDEILKELLAGDEIFKIAMVSDTFVRRFLQFEEQIKNHENLFILFDEADMYQTESSYRESMEDCMRIFLKLPEERRCLLTATHESYTAEEFQNLNKTNIQRENPPKKPIDIYFCEKDPLATLVEVVRTHIVDDQKIVIALNGVRACHYAAIELESEITEVKGDIGILCADSSQRKIPGKFIGTLKSGRLGKRITLITTAYFSGVDILDNAHIMICSYMDGYGDFALLSMHRIKQALGRLRNTCFSRSFICSLYQDLPEYDDSMVDDLKEKQSNFQEVCVKVFGEIGSSLSLTTPQYEVFCKS